MKRSSNPGRSRRARRVVAADSDYKVGRSLNQSGYAPVLSNSTAFSFNGGQPAQVILVRRRHPILTKGVREDPAGFRLQRESSFCAQAACKIWPNADEAISVTISQTIAPTPVVVVEMQPRATWWIIRIPPKASRIRYSAAATTAPPITAPQAISVGASL